MNPSSSSASSSSSSKRKRDRICFDDEGRYKRPKHDVFLNYSYEDIGNGFVSHLKGALGREGFNITDNTMLPVCQDQSSEVLKAIEESEIYLVVFSEGYASSKQCLDELVSIMDCVTRFKKKRVFPIFLNIDPSDIRSRNDPDFMKAFRAYEGDVDPETLQKWKQALTDAARRSGLTLENRDQEKFIRKILKNLMTMRNPEELFHAECPVGVDSRAQDIISALRLSDQVFNIVAVLGISGSGKTTIVKAVYDRIATDFEYKCFIEDVYSYKYKFRNWKPKLQKDVISRLTRNAKSAIIGDGAAKIIRLIMGRKVLLVLDGVDTFEHLAALGIHHASFSCSSRIIVTTTNKQSLVNLQYTPYDMRLFDRTESFELFAGLTFRKDNPVDEKFVKQVVWHAGGLPLVVDVWSRHFKCYERKLWPSILETLKRIPHEDTQKKLQMSYDSLTNKAKKLFLDIACFFDGMDKDLVVQVLQDEDSGFFPEFEIQHLVDRGLVKINRFGQLVLHQTIKEMGQEVVRQENEDEPGRRTRLIADRDVVRVLEDCSGTESVESIRWIQHNYTKEALGLIYALRKMRNLRLIQLEDIVLEFSQDDKISLCLCLKKLRYMKCKYFPFKSLDAFDMGNVVVLRLIKSSLEILWKGLKSLKKLRILDVSFSRSLTQTGNFIGLENLDELDLKYCDQLEELHGSVSQLHKLRTISLDVCAKLESIPNLPPSIEEIEARRCTSLVNLPDSIGQLHKLRKIFLSGCAKLESIPNLPPSIEEIEATYCTSLVNLPDSIGQLHKLRKIFLSGCAKLEVIPNLLPSIEEIEVRDCTSLVNLPDSIGQLHKLRKILCAKLELIPNLPPSIEEIEVRDCTSLVNLPDSIGQLHRLRIIRLDGCAKLESIPNLPPSIEELRARCCTSLVNLPDSIGQLHKLRKIFLSGCAKLEVIPNLPPSIEEIEVRDCTSLVNLPDSIGQLHRLRIIRLDECAKLESIPNLPPSIEELRARNCTSLVNLPDSIGQLHKLRKIFLSGCAKLEVIPNLPPSIEKINVRDCTSMVNLPDSIGQLHRMRIIHLDGCAKLESIPNLPPSIEEIEARYCTSLVNLPDSISQLHKLRKIFLSGCAQLEVIPNLPPSIEEIEVRDCTSLVNLPDSISQLHRLRIIRLDGVCQVRVNSKSSTKH